MKNLVIGLGEVGSAIQKILQCNGYDLDKGVVTNERYQDVIHICFPYTESFVKEVRGYIEMFRPKLVIVHSTVPIGTCDKYGWVHSPVRGVHPNLEQGIRTFVKFFGGQSAYDAAQIFVEKGILCSIHDEARTMEALKLWDTTQYGVMILLEKEIHKFCSQYGLDYDVIYGEANKTYNEGYQKLGRPDVMRPWLRHIDGPIGGHCIVPNAHLLESLSARRIIEENTQL
jgi:UDP-N-acetyl-D-mannosaminuronate dehydrogenase